MIAEVLGDRPGIDVVSAADRCADDQPQLLAAVEVRNLIRPCGAGGKAPQHERQSADG
jgi:hypothetical protein